MPRSKRMSSASGSVGPLAASATICARMRGAFSRVMTFSSAAGTSTSQSNSSTSRLSVRSPPVKPTTEPGLELVRDQTLDVEPAFVRDAALRIGDRDDAVAALRHQLRRVHSGVAEALNRNARAFDRLSERLHRFVDDVHAAARRRLVAPERSADRDRLAGNDSRNRVAVLHRERVHDPGHDLRRRVDVRRGNVFLRTDDDRDLGREAAGEVLELLHRHVLGIADDAALRAAERDVDERALPRHPHRQRLDFVERHVGMEADAALAGSARQVVLHAIAGEHAKAAVVHAGGNGDLEHALGLTQITVERFVQADEQPDFVELALRHLPDVIARLNGRKILKSYVYLYRPLGNSAPRACAGSGRSSRSARLASARSFSAADVRRSSAAAPAGADSSTSFRRRT